MVWTLTGGRFQVAAFSASPAQWLNSAPTIRSVWRLQTEQIKWTKQKPEPHSCVDSTHARPDPNRQPGAFDTRLLLYMGTMWWEGGWRSGGPLLMPCKHHHYSEQKSVISQQNTISSFTS